MSELLAADWNVSKLPHDDGLDLIATKAGDLRTFQVKTAHEAGGPGKYTFVVQHRAAEKYASVWHYYVLVLRRIHAHRYVNEYIILNSQDIGQLESGEGRNDQ